MAWRWIDKPKHVAKTMFIDYILMCFLLNKILYEYWITQPDGSNQNTRRYSDPHNWSGGSGETNISTFPSRIKSRSAGLSYTAPILFSDRNCLYKTAQCN